MANAFLTPTAVTRKALQVLHQKLNFVGSVNRQYDASFGKSGAKIGDSLKIRLPNQYSVRTGATLSAQDISESSVTLQVATQKGVDLNFTSDDLTLDLDDFSARVLEPAMAVLAANIESDALSMYKNVYRQVNNQASASSLSKVLAGRKLLNDALAPGGKRIALCNTQDIVDIVTDTKGLFQDSSQIASQYREGMMGRTAGFDFYENTMLAAHPRGAANTSYLSNGATQSGASIIVDTGTGALAVGDIVTFAGVYDVHPETKAAYSYLKQFVITAAYAGGSGTISISPALVASGATQNASSTIADNSAITVSGTASTSHGVSLLYHPDAFAFATADLVMPEGVDWAAREVYDGISMRIVRQYDINNDKFPARLDVLYGYKCIRPDLAVRLASN